VILPVLGLGLGWWSVWHTSCTSSKRVYWSGWSVGSKREDSSHGGVTYLCVSSVHGPPAISMCHTCSGANPRTKHNCSAAWRHQLNGVNLSACSWCAKTEEGRIHRTAAVVNPSVLLGRRMARFWGLHRAFSYITIVHIMQTVYCIFVICPHLPRCYSKPHTILTFFRVCSLVSHYVRASDISDLGCLWGRITMGGFFAVTPRLG
jgi:hypothetical protein